jgi:hypothetical protein
MTAGTSTNTLGFILWTLALAAVGWASTVAVKWWELKRQNASSPLRTAFSDSLWPGIAFSPHFLFESSISHLMIAPTPVFMRL